MRAAGLLLLVTGSLAHAQIEPLGLTTIAAMGPMLTSRAAAKPNRYEDTEVACTAESDCRQGDVCWDRHCRSPEQRSSLQLWIRQRSVELREELALGQGPVLRAVTPAPEGLKRHRRELLAIIGDGTDRGWPARFLERVHALEAT